MSLRLFLYYSLHQDTEIHEAAVLPCEGSLYPDGESNRGKAGDSYHECGKCGVGQTEIISLFYILTDIYKRRDLIKAGVTHRHPVFYSDRLQFYLPGDGGMKLQFFHVKDLCILMERVIEEKPETHIVLLLHIEIIFIVIKTEIISLFYILTDIYKRRDLIKAGVTRDNIIGRWIERMRRVVCGK